MLEMNSYQDVVRKSQNINPSLKFFDATDRRGLCEIALTVSGSFLPVSAGDQWVAGRAEPASLEPALCSFKRGDWAKGDQERERKGRVRSLLQTSLEPLWPVKAERDVLRDVCRWHGFGTRTASSGCTCGGHTGPCCHLCPQNGCPGT